MLEDRTLLLWELSCLLKSKPMNMGSSGLVQEGNIDFFFNTCLNIRICLNGNGFCLEADGGAEQLNLPSAQTLKIKIEGTVRYF